jgi:NADPH:quinone reductase-like Zn-dependent oxidoreductase
MGLVIGFGKPRNPILGSVLAGEVESVGKAVKRFRPGDQVYGWTVGENPLQIRFGTYAEYLSLPENFLITRKPSNLTYAEAAAIPYGACIALYFLRKGNLHRGQRILIYGVSAAIGTAAIQLAKYFGAYVSGVCSTTNLELVQSLGADTLIDYTRADAPPSGALYDLILDAVGKRKTSAFKEHCQTALTPSGKYFSVDDGLPKIHTADLVLLRELIEAGKLKAVIDRCYPLEQMAEAHRYVEAGQKRGNVVITVIL